jgi:hypothetical protein
MEEFNQDSWIWIDVSDTQDDCVFCGTVFKNDHLATCPSNIISYHEGATRLWTRLFDDEKTTEDYYSDIGKQLMMAADQILKAQQVWTDKTILQKMDEVFNNWGILTEFAEVLYELKIVQTPTEIIDYYKNPTMYEREFTIWSEFDYPFVDEDTWQDFISRLNLQNNGEDTTRY